MFMKQGLLVFAALFVLALYAKAEAQISSVYTDLSEKSCQTGQENKETGASVRKCPGVAGFHLLVMEDDNRMSVSVITPDGKEHPLDYWNVVTRSFSSLGQRAEWRVVNRSGKITPLALIIRVNAYEQENLTAPKKTSYLTVTKIRPEEMCVTDKINAAVNGNQQARQAADNSANKACLKP